MNKILLSSVALIATVAAASAADLPRRTAPAPVYAPPIMAFSWTGFYVGAQIGYAFGDVNGRLTDAVGGNANAYSYSPDGFIGGLHAGFNWQFGSIVTGLEGDVEYSGLSGRNGVFGVGAAVVGPNGGAPFYHTTDINWQASLRARLGVAFDRALIYVTGGAAFADTDHTIGSVGFPAFHTYSDTRWGWTLGGGLEYAFTNNWTARAEYRYTDFGRVSNLNAVQNSRDSNDLTTHTIRLGVSYKF